MTSSVSCSSNTTIPCEFQSHEQPISSFIASSGSSTTPLEKDNVKQMAAVGVGELVERLPHALLLEILSMLNVESLYSAATVCRALRSSASQVLFSLSTVDLSGLTPTTQILRRIMHASCGLRGLTLDCSQLDDSSVNLFAKQHLEKLVLLKCNYFTAYIFLGIGQNCLNLRELSLELVYGDEPYFVHDCSKAIEKMFKGCQYLESLSIKLHTLHHFHQFETVQFFLPQTLKTLLLQPASYRKASELISDSRIVTIDADIRSAVDVHNLSLLPPCLMLQSLTLVLNVITDELVATIMNYVPYLSVLSLEDSLFEEKTSHHNDLSNAGLQLLSSSKKLTQLSLSRRRPNYFKRVTDVGFLIFAEGCKGLESLRLEGFSKVTDAGYISFMQSFRNLKRFEVINSYFLSDLAFHDLASVADSLVEVVLISCNLLTSETADSLSLCKNLETLDLRGCKSIADDGLNSISMLCNLTLLDLSGADITDSGLSALGLCRSPIANLCLRGCKRISDAGFKKLFKMDSVISRTLSTLDLGFLPGVSDETLVRISTLCRVITSLCIRHCSFITDASMKVLGLMPDMEGRRRSIKRLDLYNCRGLSTDSIRLFSHPYFQGLHWLGFGNTKLHGKVRGRIEELSNERPLLNICVYGCEMGCINSWFLH